MPEEQTQEIPVQPQKPIQLGQVLALSKKKFNLSAIAISLVVISLIAIGIAFGMQIGKKQTTPTIIPQPTVIPSPNETVYTEQSRSANWKTYTSQNGKYTIKYPADWIVRGDEFFETEIGMGMVSVSTIDSSNNQFSNQIRIAVTKGNLQGGKEGLEVWAKEHNGYLETTKIDDVSGYKLTWVISDPTGSASRVTLRAERNGLLFDIELSVDDKTLDKETLLIIGNQILSTFKFLD